MVTRIFLLLALLAKLGACVLQSASQNPATRGLAASDASTRFLALCEQSSRERQVEAAFCRKISQKFFAGERASQAVTLVSPADLGAPALPIDARVDFAVFNDPNYLAGVAYCYFVFRGWVKPAELSPDDMGLRSSGFSILNEDLASYERWLERDPAGKGCREQVQKVSGVPVAPLSQLLKGKTALVGLNPIASVKNGHMSFQAVHDDLALTVNHERVHAYQVLCPALEAWGQQKWKELPADEQAKFSVVYPCFNWADVKVAGREYVAFAFETKPLKILEHTKNCKITRLDTGP